MSKSHVVSHITVASKVTAYLKCTSRSSAQRLHCDRLGEWLSTLGRQIGGALPPPQVKEAPSWDLVHSWVAGVDKGARDIMGGKVSLTPTSAQQIQAAVITQLVVGSECTSPLRLGIIKSLVHPSRVRMVVAYVGRSPSPSCLQYPPCAPSLMNVAAALPFPILLQAPPCPPYLMAAALPFHIMLASPSFISSFLPTFFSSRWAHAWTGTAGMRIARATEWS